MNNDKYIGISLGNVCYSAEWAVHNGYRKRKEDGYNTCPFDLMVSNYKGIVKCIKEDFKYFCDTNYLSLNNNMIHNTYYNFGFNHESPYHADIYLHENWPEGPNHFVNNEYTNFIKRYDKRIQSFRNYLNNPNNKITFIIHFAYDSPVEDDFLELREVLAEKYPKLKYRIKVIDTNPEEKK
jgi:hypothetical protein